MRIDLHAHTQKCKVGDGSARTISPELFVKKMQENGVGICSITNHNKFDKEEYKKVVGASEDIIAFPGIELDVIFEGEDRQLILVCNPKFSDKFHSTFDNDPKRDLENYKLDYSELLKKIKGFEKDGIIIIAHFMNKAKGFKVEERNTIYKDLSGYTLILETSNLRSMGFVNGHREALCLIGSDIKDWDNYSASALPELKFPIDSFGKFYELASDPANFVKNFLNGAPKHKIPLSKSSSSLDVFEDINVIFGEKGSGKTVLIRDSIKPELDSIGKKTKLHLGNKYTEYYNEIIDERSSAVEIDQDKCSEIATAFESITSYKEQPHSNFISDYVAYKSDVNKSKQAKSIKKIEASFSNHNNEVIEDVIEKARKDINKISDVLEINREIKRDSETRRKALEIELNDLKIDVQKNTAKSLRVSLIMSGTERLLRTIKETVKKESGAIPKPSTVGFSKLVSARRVRLRANHQLIQYLGAVEAVASSVIGELPKKGKVYLDVAVKVMPQGYKYKKGSKFDMGKVKQNRTIIEKIYIFSPTDFSTINSYFEHEDILRLPNAEEFVGEIIKKEVTIKIEDKDNYEPSDGEQAILSISAILESYEYDCYLFDEIEKGLGHKYISDYLVPQLKKLRDRGKTIVLTTHDANIAVSTLPSQTVFCSWPDGGVYFTGNMYSNELVDIENGTKLNWLEKAIIHLEGGDKMFNKRRNIYGV